MKRIYSPDKIYSQPEYVSGNKPHGFVLEDEEYEFFYKRSKQKAANDRQWQLKNKDDATYYEAKAYDEQVQKLLFLDYDYPRAPDLQPFLYFYKFLSRKPEFCKRDLTKFSKLELWIPDTVVFNDAEQPFWIYTNHEGLVCRTEKFSERHVVAKLGNQYSIDELVATCKTADNDGRLTGNKIQLLSTRDLAQKMSGNSSSSDGPFVIQKFVKSKGPNAFITRAVWRKNKPPSCFVITNKTSFFDPNKALEEPEKYITNVRKQLSCSIIHSKGGKVSEESCYQVEKIVKFFEKYTGYFIEEMVCDFIKDESGLWWFIGCRGFKLYGNTAKPTLKYFISEIVEDSDEDEEGKLKKKNEESNQKQEYTKLRMCRFCQIGYPVSELTHSLTLLMILKTEKKIKEQQLGSDHEWLNHGDPQYYDQVSLYQPHKVCKTCFNIYKEVEELQRVEKKFAKALGIPIEHNNKEEKNLKPKEEDNLDPIEMLNKKKDEDIETLSIKELYRFRIILTLHEINDFDFNIPILKKNSLQLEYSILNVVKTYRLYADSQNNYGSSEYSDNKLHMPINKIRMYYFFTKDHDAFLKFIKEEKLKVRLLYEGHELATAQYSLLEFRSPYVTKIGINSLICGSNNNNCYLKFYIGVIGTENKVDVREVKILNFRDGIYLPPDNYYACEVLPEDWIDIIPSQQQTKLWHGSSIFNFPKFLHQGDQSSPGRQRETLFKKYQKKASGEDGAEYSSKNGQRRQPSQKSAQSGRLKQTGGLSHTLRTSATTANLHSNVVVQKNQDIRIKNNKSIRVKTAQNSEGAQEGQRLKKHKSQGTIMFKQNKMTKKQTEEDLLLTQKLQQKLKSIKAINDLVDFEQHHNTSRQGDDQEDIETNGDQQTAHSIEETRSASIHTHSVPTISTFNFRVNHLQCDTLKSQDIQWICLIEVFKQKFVSDMYEANQPGNKTVKLGFEQSVHIQENPETLHQIMNATSISFKLQASNKCSYIGVFNLAQLLQYKTIDTQLILHNINPEMSDYVKVAVYMEVEEQDLVVLKGRKTMRQTIQVGDVEGHQLKPFEIIIPF